MTKDDVVGIISDTHGLLRPEALAALADVSLIIHAGDIGSSDILPALRRYAPVVAVRGNNDVEPWASNIPDTDTVDFGGYSFYVLHDLHTLNIEAASGVDVIVSGHSHKPLIERRAGVFFVNPGSAGPRRFRLPVTVAHVRIKSGELYPEIVPLLHER
jgi:uncharacterized protein